MIRMTTFALGNKTIMCTRTIKINDALMDRVKPLFPSDDDLQLWLEKQIEAALLSISSVQEMGLPCCHTDKEMCEIVKERLQSIEDGTATLVDGKEVFSEIRLRYGFEASLA